MGTGEGSAGARTGAGRGSLARYVHCCPVVAPVGERCLHPTVSRNILIIPLSDQDTLLPPFIDIKSFKLLVLELTLKKKDPMIKLKSDQQNWSHTLMKRFRRSSCNNQWAWKPTSTHHKTEKILFFVHPSNCSGSVELIL